MTDDTQKPRVKFCWECGRKLYGNHFAFDMLTRDSETTIDQVRGKLDERRAGV